MIDLAQSRGCRGDESAMTYWDEDERIRWQEVRDVALDSQRGLRLLDDWEERSGYTNEQAEKLGRVVEEGGS